MMDRTALTPGEVRITSADLPTLERLHLLHAVLDDAALPARLRLPAWLRRALLEHARGLLRLGAQNVSGELPTTGVVPQAAPGPDPHQEPHPDAELLALGAEMELLGEVLRTWPDDATAEQADARLAAVEQRIAALVPRTGAGLAVKLRLVCTMWAGGGPIRPGDGGSSPDGQNRVRFLRRLVGEAEALDAALPREAGRG
jgi:hypothetical protein